MRTTGAGDFSVPSRLALASRAVVAQPERTRTLGSHAAPHHPLAASAYCLSSLSFAAHGRRYLRQEPDAGNPLVRIRGGGCDQSRFLLRLCFISQSTLHRSKGRRNCREGPSAGECECIAQTRRALRKAEAKTLHTEDECRTQRLTRTRQDNPHTHLLIRFGSLRLAGVFFAEFVCEGTGYGERFGVDAGRDAARGKRGEDGFRGDIADEVVASEGTAAEARERAIEAAAAGFVRGEDLRGCSHRPAVQVHADFDPADAVFYRAIKLSDFFG